MNPIVNRILLLLYTAINVLFVEKYVSRLTSYHWVVAIGYVVWIIFAVGIIWHYLPKCKHISKWLWGLLCCFVCVSIGLQYSIDPLSLQVDRWSAIHNFLSGMLSGHYPYGQQTHLGGYGSPFPVWQILHLPFYAVGNVGLSMIAVTVLFIWTVYRLYSARVASVVLILLSLSPAFWYEIAVRSDLMTNLMVSAIIVEWLMHRRIQLADHVLGIGILMGCMLSTRLVAIIPLCVVYGYAFLQMNWRKQCALILVVALVFVATFLPFVFWKGSTLLFFEYNPFVLQTRQGSMGVLLVFALAAIGITIWLREQLAYRLITTGLLLTGLVALAFVAKMWQDNAWTELFSSTFDITYLSIALPFYVLQLSLLLANSDRPTPVSNS